MQAPPAPVGHDVAHPPLPKPVDSPIGSEIRGSSSGTNDPPSADQSTHRRSLREQNPNALHTGTTGTGRDLSSRNGAAPGSEPNTGTRASTGSGTKRGKKAGAINSDDPNNENGRPGSGRRHPFDGKVSTRIRDFRNSIALRSKKGKPPVANASDQPPVTEPPARDENKTADINIFGRRLDEHTLARRKTAPDSLPSAAELGLNGGALGQSSREKLTPAQLATGTSEIKDVEKLVNSALTTDGSDPLRPSTMSSTTREAIAPFTKQSPPNGQSPPNEEIQRSNSGGKNTDLAGDHQIDGANSGDAWTPNGGAANAQQGEDTGRKRRWYEKAAGKVNNFFHKKGDFVPHN